MAKTPRLGLPLPSCTPDGSTFLKYRSDMYDAMMDIDDIVGELRKNPINTQTLTEQADWAVQYRGLDGYMQNRPFFLEEDGTCAKVPFKYLPYHYVYMYAIGDEEKAQYSAHCAFAKPGDLIFILTDADLSEIF